MIGNVIQNILHVDIVKITKATDVSLLNQMIDEPKDILAKIKLKIFVHSMIILQIVIEQFHIMLRMKDSVLVGTAVAKRLAIRTEVVVTSLVITVVLSTTHVAAGDASLAVLSE